MSAKRLLLPLTLITLAGAALRFYQLNSIPAGLHYDIAANAILVEDIALRGYRPAFISAYTGKEVLFFYSAAALFRLIGSSVFALRATAAFWGVLTIPITYFALRQLLRHQRHSRWLAAFGAAMLAFSFAHLVWSRFGLRAITQPAVQAMAVGFIFRALRAGRTRDFWLAGLFTGLSAHTYLAARALPLALAAGALPLLRSRWRARRSQQLPSGAQLLGFLLAAGVVVTPLTLHFWAHPQEFFTRIAQVAPRASEAALLWRGVAGALGMLFFSGEPYHRFNIPGKALLGPLLGTLFVLGFALTAWRLLRPRGESTADRPMNRAAEWILLAWIPVFLLPTALAVHEVSPSNVRAFGLFPLLFAFPARGLLVVLDRFSARRAVWKHRFSIALTTLAALTFVFAARDYFSIWARLKTQHLANDGDLSLAAQFLNARDLSGSNVYVSAIHHRHPTMAYLADDYERIRWLRGAQALAIPADGPALYLFPQSAPAPAEWLIGWEAVLAAAPLDPVGKVDFRAYQFARADAVPQPEFQRAYANFGHIAELTGFRVVTARAAQPLLADLQLHVLNPPNRGDYRLVADLVDAWGYPWAQAFNESFPAEQWRVGDSIIARMEIPLPTGIPPGEYRLAVTLYSPGSRQNLPALDADGRTAAAALVGPLQLARATEPGALPAPEHNASARFGDIKLLGYDLPLRALRPGEMLPLALYWQAGDAPSEDYIISLMLGETTLDLSAPVRGSYPTDRWEASEVVIDRRNPRLPRSFPSGERVLRLSVANSGRELGGFALGEIAIEKIKRQWAAPAAQYATDFTIGETFRLMGYDLTPGPPLTVQLHWQSIAVSDSDFTVFVHALNQQEALSAQSDSQPVGSVYPTSLWMQSEFVADSHTLTLPPGEYSLALGMYLPATGERLLLRGGEDAIRLPAVTVP